MKVFYDDNGRIGMNRNNKTRQTSRYKRMEDFLDFIPITQNPSSRAESVAEEFKKKIVRLHLEDGQSLKSLADEYNISRSGISY